MRLFSQKLALLIIVAAFACRDTGGPSSGSTLYARFVLENIDGRPVPTYLAATPGPTATIFSSTLTLDKEGRAVMTEHRRIDFPGTQPEGTYTSTFTYVLHGNRIEMAPLPPCPAAAICDVGPVGTISSDGLSLVINPTSDGVRITYNYRIASTLTL
jgi:hypothetical protein